MGIKLIETMNTFARNLVLHSNDSQLDFHIEILRNLTNVLLFLICFDSTFYKEKSETRLKTLSICKVSVEVQ
jgi:hypothetical protein